MGREDGGRRLEALATSIHGDLLAAGDDRRPAEDRIAELVDRHCALLPDGARLRLRHLIERRAAGLGPLEDLLADPKIDEILVCGTAEIHVERAGLVEPAGVAFSDEDSLRSAIDRMLAPIGRRVDESSPLCDGRLPDGSRINVVLPPLAVDGPALTIRRFRERAYTAGELVAAGSWSPALRDLLEDAVTARRNIVVTGGTGAGKTTTLAAIAAMLGERERVVTIEDTAELRLALPHVVRLEARPPNVEGRGAVTIRDLVRNALRMRPDRIVVGEVRGAEALDMLAAMTTGHDGSLTTLHASSPAAALRRLQTLVAMADVALPHRAAGALVADGIDLLVHQSRLAGGRRAVVEVSRVRATGSGPVAETVMREPAGTT